MLQLTEQNTIDSKYIMSSPEKKLVESPETDTKLAELPPGSSQGTDNDFKFDAKRFKFALLG